MRTSDSDCNRKDQRIVAACVETSRGDSFDYRIGDHNQSNVPSQASIECLSRLPTHQRTDFNQLHRQDQTHRQRDHAPQRQPDGCRPECPPNGRGRRSAVQSHPRRTECSATRSLQHFHTEILSGSDTVRSLAPNPRLGWQRCGFADQTLRYRRPSLEFWNPCLTVLPCESAGLGTLCGHQPLSSDLASPHDNTVCAASVWLLRRKL
jgi:hypothetical protein